MQKDKFAIGEDVDVTIGFGHTGLSKPIDKYTDLPFCLFLDYGKEEELQINDYRHFKNYLLIEEIDPDVFYTDDYRYYQEGRFAGKTYNHEIDYSIPYEYFADLYASRPNYTHFKLIAVQLYSERNGRVVRERGRAEIDLTYNFNERSGKIEILFG